MQNYKEKVIMWKMKRAGWESLCGGVRETGRRCLGRHGELHLVVPC